MAHNKFLFTIGHSTRTIDEFMDLLIANKVEQLVDVRTIPKSRFNPQFNTELLANSLEKGDIGYIHIEKLGGLRHTSAQSVNLGWKNKSFRGYADYMSTQEFEKGLVELENIAKKRLITIMCAEAVPWRCHRSLIGDALVTRGWQVLDIISLKNVSEHRMTPFLKVRDGKLVYPHPEYDSLPI